MFMYHNGSHGVITNTTGNLHIIDDSIKLQNSNSTTRLEVTTSGVDVTGTLTATTFSGSGASLTNLNGSNIASGTIPVARIGTGTKNSTTFYRGDGTFQVVSTDLVDDSSPQLGGNLDTNGSNIIF